MYHDITLRNDMSRCGATCHAASTRIHTYIHAHVYVCIYIYMRVCPHAHMYIYIYIYMQTNELTRICINAYTIKTRIITK